MSGCYADHFIRTDDPDWGVPTPFWDQRPYNKYVTERELQIYTDRSGCDGHNRRLGVEAEVALLWTIRVIPTI